MIKVVRLQKLRCELGRTYCEACGRNAGVICYWFGDEKEEAAFFQKENFADDDFAAEHVDLNLICYGKTKPGKPWPGYIGYFKHKVNSNDKHPCTMSGKVPQSKCVLDRIARKVLKEIAREKSKEEANKRLQVEINGKVEGQIANDKAHGHMHKKREHHGRPPFFFDFLDEPMRVYRAATARLEQILREIPPEY
ncbi:MAG: hypothetical protein ABSA74_01655 [Candidatus Staskawiczbacteria bacterium]|jgi:hypothetical protein